MREQAAYTLAFVWRQTHMCQQIGDAEHTNDDHWMTLPHILFLALNHYISRNSGWLCNDREIERMKWQK